MSRVVQRVVITAPQSPRHWNPAFDQIIPMRSDHHIPIVETGENVIIGHCNATTHVVEYRDHRAERPQQQGDTGHTVRVQMWHYGDLPPPPSKRDASDVNLFMTMEPPAQLAFAGVEGYDGEVSFRSDSAIWRPLVDLMTVWDQAQTLRYEPERDSIGVWYNNCGAPLRNPVIEALVRSGLKIESYGNCHRNRDDVGSLHGALYDGHVNNASAACRRHRLMVAVQHTACRDYVNSNLLTPLMCGAIPIINRVDGLPAYDALLGPATVPHVDASSAGWIQRVGALVTNNTYVLARTESSAVGRLASCLALTFSLGFVRCVCGAGHTASWWNPSHRATHRRNSACCGSTDTAATTANGTTCIVGCRRDQTLRGGWWSRRRLRRRRTRRRPGMASPSG